MLDEALEIIGALFDGGYVDFGASTSGSTRRSSGTCPTSRCRSAIAVSGDAVRARRSRRWRPPDRRRARRRAGRRVADSAGAARRPRKSARCRSAGAPTGTRRSPARTSSSAGSAAAGRSTPSCPARRASPAPSQFVRPGGRRRADPLRRRRRRRWSRRCGVRDAGFTDVALVQIGDDRQEEFLRWPRRSCSRRCARVTQPASTRCRLARADSSVRVTRSPTTSSRLSGLLEHPTLAGRAAAPREQALAQVVDEGEVAGLLEARRAVSVQEGLEDVAGRRQPRSPRVRPAGRRPRTGPPARSRRAAGRCASSWPWPVGARRW